MIRIKQDAESALARIEAWLVDSKSQPERPLVPGRWVDLGNSAQDEFELHVIVALAEGRQEVKLDLQGATRRGARVIVDTFQADRAVRVYRLAQGDNP